MKITYRIPTDQYAYVELEEEKDVYVSEDIKDTYDHLVQAFKPTDGLTAKELDLIIEKMCLGTTVEGGTELWAKASGEQRDQINCLKRALSRIKAKQGKNKIVDDYAEDALSDIS